MRIVIDYRPALRARTGVGEYIHQVAGALARAGGDDITVFSSSWKDRPSDDLATRPSQRQGCRSALPVRVLNLAWHRLRWPPVEALTGGEYDIAHSPHPLLLPSRSAAQIVTIHDLHFLSHPERTSQEIRRDYPALAGVARPARGPHHRVVEVCRRRGAAAAERCVRENCDLPRWRAGMENARLRASSPRRLHPVHGHARRAKESSAGFSTPTGGCCRE